MSPVFTVTYLLPFLSTACFNRCTARFCKLHLLFCTRILKKKEKKNVCTLNCCRSLLLFFFSKKYVCKHFSSVNCVPLLPCLQAASVSLSTQAFFLFFFFSSKQQNEITSITQLHLKVTGLASFSQLLLGNANADADSSAGFLCR